MPSKIHRTEHISRRQFLNRLATGCVVAAGAGAVTWLAYSDEPVRRAPEKIYTIPDFRVDTGTVYPKIVITHGTDADKMVKAAVDKLGGIEKFIKPGDRVVIKPNVAWDRVPEQAANTNPAVVAAIVQLVSRARAKSVTVTDVSLNDPYRCFSRSGIEDAAKKSGARLFIPSEADYNIANLKGALLREWPVSRIYFEADKVINVPVVKHHSLSRCSLAQKNWYGVIGGRRNQLHQQIDTSISDLAQAMRPTLTVMDATRILMRNGPTGGSLSDVARKDIIIVGTDEVAIDSYGMGLLGVDPREVGYMELSQKRGLGVIDWKSAQWEEIVV